MARRLRAAPACLAAVLGLAWAPAALAEGGGPPGLGPDASAPAKHRYRLGRRLYRKGRFDDAAREFRVAQEMVPDSPRLAYNLARSLERAGRLDEAISEYEHYLRLAPGADDVADVLQVLAALKRMVGEGRGKLAVTSAPPGATVFIDGSTDPAGVTPLRVWLSPGTHRVRVELEDLPPLERLVDVEAGALAEVAAVLAPEGAPDGGPDEAGAGFPWHLAAAGVAVAAAGGAAWSGLAARGGLADAASATDRPAYQEAVDRAERSATLATVLWAGAGGAAAAALALWLLAGPEGEPAVAVGPGPLGAVVCGRF